jgi:hypothetical protein
VETQLGMDQYLLIPFLGGWTSIYQLFWCSPGVQGFDTLPTDSAVIWSETARPRPVEWTWASPRSKPRWIDSMSRVAFSTTFGDLRDLKWRFPKLGVAPVLIHVQIGFSMKFTIQLLG